MSSSDDTGNKEFSTITINQKQIPISIYITAVCQFCHIIRKSAQDHNYRGAYHYQSNAYVSLGRTIEFIRAISDEELGPLWSGQALADDVKTF